MCDSKIVFTVTNSFFNQKCHQPCLLLPSKKHSSHFPSTWASSCTVLSSYPLRAHTFKKRVQQVCKAKKICIWLSSKAAWVTVKSSNHEPQASIAWQARLESAFNKMLVRKGASGPGEKDVMRLTTVWVAVKNCNQSASPWILQDSAQSYKSLSFILILHGLSWGSLPLQWNSAVTRCVTYSPLQQEDMSLTEDFHINYSSTLHLYPVSDQRGRSATV